MSSDVGRRLEKLEADTVSGAVALAIAAIDIALEAPAEARLEIARQLRRMHPAIVTVANVGRFLEQPGAALRALRQSLVEGNDLIAAHLAPLLGGGARVLTLSDSSTVETALRASGHCRVWVLESLPGGEGRRLAERIGATITPDATMARVVESVDLALVGIDGYDAAGAILHKAGTLPLALCCAHLGKPFYAAGHSFKRSPVDTAALLGAAGEAGFRFDRTPGELITAIFTEQGRLRVR